MCDLRKGLTYYDAWCHTDVYAGSILNIMVHVSELVWLKLITVFRICLVAFCICLWLWI